MSGIAKKKRKSNILGDEITAMVEDIEARQHVLFCVINIGLTNKVKHSGECVATAVEGQEDKTDNKKKWSDG